MRGVGVVLAIIFVVGVVMLVGVAALEPVGEEVKDRSSISVVNGESTINNVYDVIFKWMPLFFIGGFMIWAVAWYLRRERVTNGGFR